MYEIILFIVESFKFMLSLENNVFWKLNVTNINFAWSMGNIRKLAFASPWGAYFTPSLSNNSRIVRVEIRFIGSEYFTLGQHRIRTMDRKSNELLLDQRAWYDLNVIIRSHGSSQ